MKKNILITGFILLFFIGANAQSKVFKEVNNEISSQIKTIMQDNVLVGYVVFTQLEKYSVDSFNYRITIMDENLNDIGKVNFREQNMNLQAASFEQDVLCLAYLKTNVPEIQYPNRKTLNKLKSNASHKMVTQFLNLDGKIIKQNEIKASIDMDVTGTRVYLNQGIQLRNVPQKGFVCFFGDEANNYLITYEVTGKEIWKKKIGKQAKSFYLLATSNDIYLLTKKETQKIEGGFELLSYSYSDNANYSKYALKDKKGNELKVLSFDIDPVTAKPYLTGTVISPSKNGVNTIKEVAQAPYIGVFTVHVNGIEKSDIKEVFSYWNNGENASISASGKCIETGGYTLLSQGFKDFNGDTYFIGTSVIKKTRWGSIASSVVLSPLVAPSIWILVGAGTVKCKIADGILLKQSANGSLTYQQTIPGNTSSFRMGKTPLGLMTQQKSFYHVTNTLSKSNYVIVDDIKDIKIYNVDRQKITRTIPHKDGNLYTNVYPAKEGYVMISEYNRKEKFTRVSIESL